MITKPTSLSPSAETVSIEDNQLILSTEVLSGSNIEVLSNDVHSCYATLILTISGVDYMLVCDPSQASNDVDVISGLIEYTNNAIRITFTLDLNDTYYGKVMKTSNKSEFSNISFKDLITSGMECSWKVRLFDKNSILNQSTFRAFTKIAYGSISGMQTNEYESIESVELTVFPHTTIYSSNPLGNRDRIFTTGDEDPYGYIETTVYTNLAYYDPNIRYYIEINGQQYPINFYSFVPAGDGEGGESKDYDASTYFDTYGNPIDGYCRMDPNNTTQLNDNVNVDDNYVIYANYIDSKSAYFDIYDTATIKIYDIHNSNIDVTSYNDVSNLYTITYCNLDFNINYTQAQGINPNYYNYRIYLYNDYNGSFELVYASGNMYNIQLLCTYDRLLPNRTYKVNINIVDTQKRVYTNDVYIHTNYKYAKTNIKAEAQYYSPHNSVIIDWSDIESIMPNGADDDYLYVNLNDNSEILPDGEHNALSLTYNQALSYTTDNFGNALNFKNATLGLVFKGTNLTQGTIAWISMGDGNHIIIQYDSGSIVIRSNTYSYQFNLYGNYTQEDLINALSSSQISTNDKRVPFIWGDPTVNFNELVWKDDTYYWHEDDLINENVFMIVANSEQCYIKNLTKDTVLTGVKNDLVYTNGPGWSFISIYGYSIIKRLYVTTDNSPENWDSMITDYNNWVWNDNTRLLCYFNDTLNGSASNIEWSNVSGFRVYKLLGNSDYLYEIGNIDGIDTRIIEDFAVGDNCQYVYYVYPIIDNGDGTFYLGTVIKTDPIIFDKGVNKVFGLKEITQSDGTAAQVPTYEVITDQVWRLMFNLEDTGFTLNTDKTFYDTLSTYSTEYVGNRKYITKSISAMIGDVDCAFKGSRILDTYDMLISWNDFSSSTNLKCLIDSRGLILPGNFEANPAVEYMDIKGNPAVAKFTWRQKSDLKIINIYGRLLSFNPLKESYLSSNENYSLGTVDNMILTVKRG